MVPRFMQILILSLLHTVTQFRAVTIRKDAIAVVTDINIMGATALKMELAYVKHVFGHSGNIS